MSPDGRWDWIEAYYDGELPLPRRWWAAVRLARDPRARAELAALRALGEAVRDAEDAEGAAPDAPDVWPALAGALEERRRPRAWAAPAPWAAATAAVLAAAAVLVLTLREPGLTPGAAPATPQGAVRWLDAVDRPMMVLRDDGEATIIWLPDPSDDRASGREVRHGTA